MFQPYGEPQFREVGNLRKKLSFPAAISHRRNCMNAIIYLVGLVVVVMAILSFIGLR
jgi:hypothetical protein